MPRSFNIEAIRNDFPNLTVTVYGKPLVYLDNAATTFKPQCVIERVAEHYRQETANIHRGVHYLSEKATAAYEESREKVQRFIHAKSAQEIIFTRGATESINLVANSFGRAFLKAGDEILISEMEHHSNIVPWQMLCEQLGTVLKVIPINDRGEYGVIDFEQCLSSKTKFVSLVYISNSLGTINPLPEIIQICRKKGIPVLVDGAQTVNHMPVDIQTLDCDFFVFSGHKVFGPTGVGVLYGNREHLERMPPYQGGGDMIASVTFEKTTYNTIPYKFEAGTPHIDGVIGLGTAIDYLQSFDFKDIITYENELLGYATQTLSALPGVKIIGTARSKAAVVSFVLDGIHAHDLGTLVDEDGIAIRTGHHCTQPVMKHFKIPATSRASFAFYNTKEEVDLLAKSILRAKTIF